MNKMTMKLFAAVLVGVLSVGCVNNHVALLEAHSIGSQYREGSLKKVAAGTYFGNPKYEYIKYESPRSDENDTTVFYSLKVAECVKPEENKTK